MFTNPTLLALYAQARHESDLHPRRSAPRRRLHRSAAAQRPNPIPSALAAPLRRPSEHGAVPIA